MSVKKIIDPKFQGGLHFDDTTKVSRAPMDATGYSWVYSLETRYGLSTREVNLYHLGDDDWSGNVVEFGEWRYLEWYEIEQAKNFLKEKGYL